MSNSIDTKIISKLAEILDKNGLSELECEVEGCRISLVKSRTISNIGFVPENVAPAPAAVLPSSSAEVKEENKILDVASIPGCVKSPMVGVVYLASDPNSPDYVKIGDTVSQGDTVCLIEAMKTFNPVIAHTSGRVTKILVESGDPVEYGEPLVVIE